MTTSDDLLTVHVDGFHGPVHVRTQGPVDAPVLVAIHGFSGSLQWWERVAVPLADTHRIVRVDLLGHGRTGGPAVDAPVQARMVEAVLRRLDLAQVTIAGHSFGADVAVELAETSSRVERLVIVCQAPDYSDAHLPRARAVMLVPGLAPVLHRSAVGLGRALVGIGGRFVADPGRQQLARQAITDFAAMRTPMFGVVIRDRGERMARRPLDAQLRDSGKPALVILGGRDHFYGDRSAGRYRAAGAEVVVLPGSGHSPLVEAPERMVEILRGFLPAS